MSSKKTIKILIGIVALAVIARLTSSTSPAIGAISHAFPHANNTAVESIATIGDAAAVISALLIGKMLDRWTFKNIAMISVFILTLGGLLPLVFHQSVNQLLLWGFIAGLGTGGITTVLPSLQAYAFSGEKLATMLGVVVSIENGSSMVLVFLSGLLANQNWLHAYYLFFLALITLVITLIVIPNHRPDQKENIDEDVIDTPVEKTNTIAVVGYLLVACVMILLEAVLYNKNALYIQHFNLGSPALAGRIMMLDGLAAIVVGLIIKWIRQIFGRYILVFSFGLVVCGSALLLLWHTKISIAIATFVIGAGSATMLMTVPYILSTLATAKQYPLVMGFFSAITSLGFSSSALIFNSFVGQFTKNILQGTYAMQLAIAAIMSVILLATTYLKRNK